MTSAAEVCFSIINTNAQRCGGAPQFSITATFVVYGYFAVEQLVALLADGARSLAALPWATEFDVGKALHTQASAWWRMQSRSNQCPLGNSLLTGKTSENLANSSLYT